MDWDEVFAQLQSEYDVAVRAQERQEAAELARAERANTVWIDRMRARVGHEISIRLIDGSLRTGTVMECTRGWLRLRHGGANGRARASLIPASAVTAAWPLAQVAPPPSAVASRLTLGHALRGLAEAGLPVSVQAVGFTRQGRICAVGKDHVDIAGADGTAITFTWAQLVCIGSA